MPRAVSRPRQKGPCGDQLPPKVVKKINEIVAETNVNDNQQKDDKHWQFVWLLILEAVFIIYCPEIKNIAICAFLITVFCYPFFKESDDKKKENDNMIFDEHIELTLIVDKKLVITHAGKIIKRELENFIFFVNKNDLKLGISLNIGRYHSVYEHPQCSGFIDTKPWFEKCEIVSGNKVLFSIGSLYYGTEITVKNGNEELLKKTICF